MLIVFDFFLNFLLAENYPKMKVLILTLLIVALAAAIPVDVDSGDESQLSLVDVDNEQSADENAADVTRSKRFILKKIALVKAGALGIG